MRLLLLPFAPTFSLKAFDPSDPGGRIVVEMYPHRTPDAPPMFILRPAEDRHWYAFFHHQLEIMVKNGRERPLGIAPASAARPPNGLSAPFPL